MPFPVMLKIHTVAHIIQHTKVLSAATKPQLLAFCSGHYATAAAATAITANSL